MIKNILSITALILSINVNLVSASELIVPHKAFYKVVRELGKVNKSDKSILDGSIAVEISGNSCDGYITNTFRKSDMLFGDEKALMESSFSSYENIQEKIYKFESLIKLDDNLIEHKRGYAIRDDETDKITVFFEKPSKKKIEISGHGLFPIESWLEQLKAAEKGKKIIQHSIFDINFSDDQLVHFTSFISKKNADNKIRSQDNPDNNNISKKLAKLSEDHSFWVVNDSYFMDYEDNENDKSSHQGETMPIIEVKSVLFDNGIYGNTGIKSDNSKDDIKIMDFTILPSYDCSN